MEGPTRPKGIVTQGGRPGTDEFPAGTCDGRRISKNTSSMSHLHSPSCGCSRRDVLKTGVFGCGAYLSFVLGGLSLSARRSFAATPGGETVIEKPFARIEKLADGVWAVLSTPAGGTQTYSNGGIIAGKDAVLVIEGFMTPEGSKFVAEAAQSLTGRAPSHVIVTHFHGDHTAGLGGYLGRADAPKLIATEETGKILLEQISQAMGEPDETGLAPAGSQYVVPNTLITAGRSSTELDLGGRTVRIVHRSGHTPSDVTIEVDDPRVVWCGDLFFNQVFPYYGDALPASLGKSCHAFMEAKDGIFVPGHGSIATPEDRARYLALLDDVEAAARDFHARGIPAADAWKEYKVPARLGDWYLFRPDVTRFAFEAWERELGS